jgi:phospholipid/cholesterol/gamma-HCH transport system permease protein
MFPVVTALAGALGVISGRLTAGALLDLSSVEFWKGAHLFHRDKDIWYGLVKAASFGAAVATLGAAAGLHASAGAAGVGRATTTAVVLGCMAILVLDAFWALVLL